MYNKALLLAALCNHMTDVASVSSDFSFFFPFLNFHVDFIFSSNEDSACRPFASLLCSLPKHDAGGVCSFIFSGKTHPSRFGHGKQTNKRSSGRDTKWLCSLKTNEISTSRRLCTLFSCTSNKSASHALCLQIVQLICSEAKLGSAWEKASKLVTMILAS